MLAVSGLVASAADSTKTNPKCYSKPVSCGLCTFLLAIGLLTMPATARCGTIFVTNAELTGTVGKYTTSGATVNPALISGLNGPLGIAVSGGNLFVSSFSTNRIGEYTTSGATVNLALISGLNGPLGLAVSGEDLFVANFNGGVPGGGTIGKYTTSGATVNPALISGLTHPDFLAVAVPDASSSWTLLLLGLMATLGLRVMLRQPA